MLIAFIITMSALMFGVRIIVRAHRENILCETTLTKIGTVYFSSLFAAFYFCSSQIFLVWIVSFAPLIVFIFVIEIVRFCRLRAFRKAFSESLNLTLLKMKSGKSFRQSFSETISECDASTSARLREIFDIVVFTQQDKAHPRAKFVDSVVRELRFADQNPHSSIKRLQTLRTRLKIEENFRRKSGQALKQVRAQSILMCGLFLAVVTFIILNFGFVRNQNLILTAIVLFASGSWWIQLGGRKLKWKT